MQAAQIRNRVVTIVCAEPRSPDRFAGPVGNPGEDTRYDAGVLTSLRLRYQPLTEGDAEVLQALCRDGRLEPDAQDGAPASLAWARAVITASERLFRTDGVGLWLVSRDDTPIGVCGFRVSSRLGGEPQLRSAMAGDRDAVGYANEVVETMLAQARRLGWFRVAAAANRSDVASAIALETVGFVGCGRVPGRPGDTLLFERFETPPPARLSAAVGTGWAMTIRQTWNGEPIGSDETVTVRMELGQVELTVGIDAPFHNDPPPASDDLWNHEVVEVMLVGADDKYLEVELSPHGRHLVLFLEGERRVVHRGAALCYRADIDKGRWRGRAHIPLGWVPFGTNRLNAFAIHGMPDSRRYLAWKPTRGPRPDFHRREVFGAFGTCVTDGDHAVERT